MITIYNPYPKDFFEPHNIIFLKYQEEFINHFMCLLKHEYNDNIRIISELSLKDSNVSYINNEKAEVLVAGPFPFPFDYGDCFNLLKEMKYLKKTFLIYEDNFPTTLYPKFVYWKDRMDNFPIGNDSYLRPLYNSLIYGKDKIKEIQCFETKWKISC